MVQLLIFCEMPQLTGGSQSFQGVACNGPCGYTVLQKRRMTLPPNTILARASIPCLCWTSWASMRRTLTQLCRAMGVLGNPRTGIIRPKSRSISARTLLAAGCHTWSSCVALGNKVAHRMHHRLAEGWLCAAGTSLSVSLLHPPIPPVVHQENPAGASRGAKRSRGEVFGASVDDIWWAADPLLTAGVKALATPPASVRNAWVVHPLCTCGGWRLLVNHSMHLRHHS